MQWPRRCARNSAFALPDPHVRDLILLGATMICAIASTTFLGCLPEAVSADSITASVPSMTAFATSETSARVGIVLVIIDSIIWVA